uniref:Delta-hexatoxin-Hi1a n=1 Tax=Hadronyche infensa TaxID=153481 RepID=TDE1A_HADIN
MKVIATLYGLLFLTVVLGDITEGNENDLVENFREELSEADIPLLKKLEAIEDALLEKDFLPYEEEDRNARPKRCAKVRNWCAKNEDCCCPMKCIGAWYNQQSSCQSTFMGMFKKC